MMTAACLYITWIGNTATIYRRDQPVAVLCDASEVIAMIRRGWLSSCDEIKQMVDRMLPEGAE